MSGFRTFLATETKRIRARRDTTLAPLLLTRAVAKMRGLSEATNPVDDERLQREVHVVFAASGREGLQRKHIRHATRLFFSKPEPIAPVRELAGAVLKGVVKFKSRIGLFNLLDAYLDHFDLEDPLIGVLAKDLEVVCETWPWKARDPWPQAIRQFQLLKPDVAPRAIASHILLTGQETIKSSLGDASLAASSRPYGKLAEACFQVACVQVASRSGKLAQPEQLRLTEWAGLDGKLLAYPSMWPEYAAALLAPFEQMRPSPAHQKTITQALIDFGGDPRIDRLKRWSQVQTRYPAAVKTIRAWLTADTFRMFFDIVDRVLTDRPDMWRDRRRYWTRYLEGDAISEAWVVLGSSIAEEAERVARATSDNSYRMFGHLAGGSARSPQHAALIMKIGDLIVVDWSHNGKWNIWRSSDPRIPVLYRSKENRIKYWTADYDPHELMNAPYYSGSHGSTGSWQWQVDQIIRNETGIRVR
jgi:EH_Signature domain